MKSKRETRESVEPLISTETGKKFFSPKAEYRITENSIMVGASFVNRYKQVNKDMMVNVHSSSRTFFNMNSVPEISLKKGIRKGSPIDKKVVLYKQSSKRSNSRNTKTFLKGLKKLTRDQSILDLVDGYVIPFQSKPFQSKTPFQKGTNKTSQYSKGRVHKQFVPCKKEEWGEGGKGQ